MEVKWVLGSAAAGEEWGFQRTELQFVDAVHQGAYRQSRL